MIRVALATHATRRASAGMRAYAEALVARVPRVAADVELIQVDATPTALPIALRRAKPDVTHIAYLESSRFLPKPYVAMVHDLIHLRFPQLFSRSTAAYWHLVAIPLYRNAARVIVSDPGVGEDVTRLLGVDAERIAVVPLGYNDLIPTATAHRAERPYLFYAGNHAAHKGLDTLYEAWTALPADLELDLVLTGPDDADVRARYTRARGTLTYLGELDDMTLAARYRGAFAYVQPSLAEGFGIPTLEATVAGTPVLATTASIPALVRPYASTFTAGDAAVLTDLIVRIARDPISPRARAAEGAVELRAYTWDRFAAATAAVYREVVCP